MFLPGSNGNQFGGYAGGLAYPVPQVGHAGVNYALSSSSMMGGGFGGAYGPPPMAAMRPMAMAPGM